MLSSLLTSVCSERGFPREYVQRRSRGRPERRCPEAGAYQTGRRQMLGSFSKRLGQSFQRFCFLFCFGRSFFGGFIRPSPVFARPRRLFYCSSSRARAADRPVGLGGAHGSSKAPADLRLRICGAAPTGNRPFNVQRQRRLHDGSSSGSGTRFRRRNAHF